LQISSVAQQVAPDGPEARHSSPFEQQKSPQIWRGGQHTGEGPRPPAGVGVLGSAGAGAPGGRQTSPAAQQIPKQTAAGVQQAPATHTSSPHGLLQPPQWLRLVEASAQRPSQQIMLGPGGQGDSQPPQCSGSFGTSRQMPVQHRNDAGQSPSSRHACCHAPARRGTNGPASAANAPPTAARSTTRREVPLARIFASSSKRRPSMTAHSHPSGQGRRQTTNAGSAGALRSRSPTIVPRRRGELPQDRPGRGALRLR
jgi:hypothetical protein